MLRNRSWLQKPAAAGMTGARRLHAAKTLYRRAAAASDPTDERPQASCGRKWLPYRKGPRQERKICRNPRAVRRPATDSPATAPSSAATSSISAFRAAIEATTEKGKKKSTNGYSKNGSGNQPWTTSGKPWNKPSTPEPRQPAGAA